MPPCCDLCYARRVRCIDTIEFARPSSAIDVDIAFCTSHYHRSPSRERNLLLVHLSTIDRAPADGSSDAGAVSPSLLCYENTPQCSQSLTALSPALLYTLPIRCDASAGSEKGGAHHSDESPTPRGESAGLFGANPGVHALLPDPAGQVYRTMRGFSGARINRPLSPTLS
jgi:hypothetical protein